MAVEQFLLFDADTERAVAAVASDGSTAETVYSDEFPSDEELRASLAMNFKQKVKDASGLDWPLMEVLRYNLYFPTGPVEEYESFEAAEAAAREAFND